MKPKFSFLMAAYNAEKYMRLAINSVVSQSIKEWELVIVVEKSSADDTIKVALEYADIDDRIKVVENDNPGSVGRARNIGIRHLEGMFTQSIDADDILSPDFLEKANEVLLKQEDVDIICPIACYIDENGNKGEEVGKNRKYIGVSIDGKKAFELSVNWDIHGWVMLRSDILRSYNYDVGTFNAEEATGRKHFYMARQVTFTDSVYYYRRFNDSKSRQPENRAKWFESLYTDEDIFDYAISEKMTGRLVAKCSDRWAKSLVAYQSLYIREKNRLDKASKRVLNILEDSFKRFNKKGIQTGKSICYRMIKISGGNYRVFCGICYLYVIPWYVRNMLTRH